MENNRGHSTSFWETYKLKYVPGTILLDTACMSPTVARATPVDHEVISELEKVLPSLPDRNVIYRELVKARADISELLTDQILNKDKKAVCNVPICGFPFLVMVSLFQPGLSIHYLLCFPDCSSVFFYISILSNALKSLCY